MVVNNERTTRSMLVVPAQKSRSTSSRTARHGDGGPPRTWYRPLGGHPDWGAASWRLPRGLRPGRRRPSLRCADVAAGGRADGLRSTSSTTRLRPSSNGTSPSRPPCAPRGGAGRRRAPPHGMRPRAVDVLPRRGRGGEPPGCRFCGGGDRRRPARPSRPASVPWKLRPGLAARGRVRRHRLTEAPRIPRQGRSHWIKLGRTPPGVTPGVRYGCCVSSPHAGSLDNTQATINFIAEKYSF